MPFAPLSSRPNQTISAWVPHPDHWTRNQEYVDPLASLASTLVAHLAPLVERHTNPPQVAARHTDLPAIVLDVDSALFG